MVLSPLKFFLGSALAGSGSVESLFAVLPLEGVEFRSRCSAGLPGRAPIVVYLIVPSVLIRGA